MFKTIILCTAVLTANLVFADVKADKKQVKFEKRQALVVEKLSQKIAGLKTHKTCVEKATDKIGLKDCKKQAKKARKERKKAAKVKREKLKAQRKAEKAAKKAHKN